MNINSEPKLVGNSETFLIFQLVYSASFEREIRRREVLYSDTLILSSRKAKGGVRDASSLFERKKYKGC